MNTVSQKTTLRSTSIAVLISSLICLPAHGGVFNESRTNANHSALRQEYLAPSLQLNHQIIHDINAGLQSAPKTTPGVSERTQLSPATKQEPPLSTLFTRIKKIMLATLKIAGGSVAVIGTLIYFQLHWIIVVGVIGGMSYLAYYDANKDEFIKDPIEKARYFYNELQESITVEQKKMAALRNITAEEQKAAQQIINVFNYVDSFGEQNLDRMRNLIANLTYQQRSDLADLLNTGYLSDDASEKDALKLALLDKGFPLHLFLRPSGQIAAQLKDYAQDAGLPTLNPDGNFSGLIFYDNGSIEFVGIKKERPHAQWFDKTTVLTISYRDGEKIPALDAMLAEGQSGNLGEDIAIGAGAGAIAGKLLTGKWSGKWTVGGAIGGFLLSNSHYRKNPEGIAIDYLPYSRLVNTINHLNGGISGVLTLDDLNTIAAGSYAPAPHQAPPRFAKIFEKFEQFSSSESTAYSNNREVKALREHLQETLGQNILVTQNPGERYPTITIIPRTITGPQAIAHSL